MFSNLSIFLAAFALLWKKVVEIDMWKMSLKIFLKNNYVLQYVQELIIMKKKLGIGISQCLNDYA